MLVQVKKYDIYLPLRYNDGRQIENEKFDQVDDVLYERFGGLTAVLREFPLLTLNLPNQQPNFLKNTKRF